MVHFHGRMAQRIQGRRSNPLRPTLILALWGLLCTSGCAARQAVQRGDEAMASRDYQGAVRAYAEALSLAPTSTTYRRLLKSAQQERGRERLQLAEEKRRSGQLKEALSLCESVLEELPANLPAIRLRDRVAEHKADLDAQLAAALADLNAGRDPQKVAERMELLLWLTPSSKQIEEYRQRALQMIKNP